VTRRRAHRRSIQPKSTPCGGRSPRRCLPRRVETRERRGDARQVGQSRVGVRVFRQLHAATFMGVHGVEKGGRRGRRQKDSAGRCNRSRRYAASRRHGIMPSAAKLRKSMVRPPSARKRVNHADPAPPA
jgi:hypothetical protein